MNHEALVSKLKLHITQQEGIEIAEVLRYTIKDYKQPTELLLPLQWDEIVQAHYNSQELYKEGKFKEAYETKAQETQAFLNLLSTLSKWALPILFELLSQLKDFALQADNESSTQNLEDCASVLSKAFTTCLMDRFNSLDVSRMHGTYKIVNSLFRIYDKLDSIGLCTNVIRALNVATNLPDLYSFPKPEIVTYQYYLGKLNFSKQNYSEALENFNNASENLPVGYVTHHQKILIYSIPLNIVEKGILCKKEMFARYPYLKKLYMPVIKAIKRSKIQRFEKALEKNEDLYIKHGVYLLLDSSVRLFIYRNLCKKVYLILNKNTKLSLKYFHDAFWISGLHCDMDEIECIISVLIYKGLVKGYISHQKLFVVLSNKDPFPNTALA